MSGFQWVGDPACWLTGCVAFFLAVGRLMTGGSARVTEWWWGEGERAETNLCCICLERRKSLASQGQRQIPSQQDQPREAFAFPGMKSLV